MRGLMTTKLLNKTIKSLHLKKVLWVPPPINNEEIRESFLNLAQTMNFKDNVVTSQVQAMTTQVNREVGPRVPNHASTMASRFRDFTRINPHIFFGSNVDEDPQDIFNLVEDSRLRRKNRKAKRDKSSEGGSSKRRLEIQDKPKVKKRFFNQVPSIFPKAHDNREKVELAADQLKDMALDVERCPSTRRISHYLGRSSDCIPGKERTDAQPRPNPTAAAEPPKRNLFYALKGSTMSFVTPLVASKCDSLPDI
ncbi:hypothetical protein EJD97_009077 [Solanum chilense]|uniref:Uncharacterized protein n=1 Tax=Solanum chilense TaxID=4083 RepID=A0A6N2BKQ0_SOLCI|nr:hypothetical protein EJD97_009077 [Solanum chilense]